MLRLVSLAALVAALSAAAPAGAFVQPGSPPPAVPSVLDGFVVTPLVASPVPTAITFGPGAGDDGPDLYATTVAGDVLRHHLAWTTAGPVVEDVTVVVDGFSIPLGLVFGQDGELYVADSTQGAESGRVDGRVTRVDGDGTRAVVVDGLPNGRHNTNNLRFGPDGRLYIANGNPNDNGRDGGDADVFPYSGAILSVDVDVVRADPAVLRWVDDAGRPIAADDIATHPRNADFAAKVDVLASGFRNVYDVAFAPDGTAYTATNGADDPSSQDLLYRITPGTDYGFPFCYNEGRPGDVGDGVSVVSNPVYPDADCSDVPSATALLGWHVCATGLDFPTVGGDAWPSEFAGDVYVAECGPFFADDLLAQSAQDPERATHNTGHKIVRVALDESGEATLVEDFLTGLTLPTDVHFGPEGAMYVADADAIYRVVGA